MRRTLFRSVLVVVALLASAVARAEGEDRFTGDLAFAGGPAMTVGPRGVRAGADLRFRYLSTAGLFVSYEDGSIFGSGVDPRRVLATGFELRPLFLGRWATGLELGTPALDLLIDSFGLEVGVAFAQPDGGRFGARPSLQLGIGLELPFFGRANGPFLGLHGGARWSEAALSGGPIRDPSDRALYLTLVLGWQQLFGGHVVDLGDRRR